MRTFILAILCVLALACTKTNNNSGSGNGAAQITIASVSPQLFYVDEQITITGTGFNADKTKDAIDFGVVDSTTSAMQFYPYPSGKNFDFTIVSASSTQLVVQLAEPDSLYQRIYPSPLNNANSQYDHRGQFRVRSGGASAHSKLVSFKKFPWIGTNGDFTHAFTPGDSALVYISGVVSNSTCAASIYLSGSKSSGCTWPEQFFNTNLYFESTPCPCMDYATVVYGCAGTTSSFQGRLISYSAENESADVVIYIPKDFFGTVYGHGVGPVVDVYAKVVNSDGRSSKPVKWALATFPDH